MSTRGTRFVLLAAVLCLASVAWAEKGPCKDGFGNLILPNGDYSLQNAGTINGQNAFREGTIHIDANSKKFTASGFQKAGNAVGTFFLEGVVVVTPGCLLIFHSPSEDWAGVFISPKKFSFSTLNPDFHLSGFSEWIEHPLDNFGTSIW